MGGGAHRQRTEPRNASEEGKNSHTCSIIPGQGAGSRKWLSQESTGCFAKASSGVGLSPHTNQRPQSQDMVMGEDWRQLLRRLRVTDMEVFETAERACRRWLGKKFTEEACAEVYAEVYVRSQEKLAENPSYFAFQSAEGFLGVAYTIAWRFFTRRFRAAKREQVAFRNRKGSPKAVFCSDETEAKEWECLRELFADCDRVVDEYLSDAAPEVREVFRLRCEGMKPEDVARKFGLKPLTEWRRWDTAREMLRKKFRGKLPGDLEKE